MIQDYSRWVRIATYAGVLLIWVIIGWGDATLLVSVFMLSYTTIILFPWLLGFLCGAVTLVPLYLALVRWQEREYRACVVLSVFAGFMVLVSFYFIWITITASLLASQSTILLKAVHVLPFGISFLSFICAALPFSTAYFLLHMLVKEQYSQPRPMRSVQAARPPSPPQLQFPRPQQGKSMKQPQQRQHMPTYIPEDELDDVQGFQ